ncbi:hypothetical protein Pcinc_008270 [Petrolisthes cinctipes]|uniref:CCHC-type domain-containing protein n=1 Tax=Petrolisthes cinctipes TaxID=88211 RepID=A0AAE1G6T8_PETCI|nr:hypothetical protein Pcinc_008270 [Petrolisthes cinctipes]
MAEGWKKFQFEWENYLEGAELTKKPSRVKTAYFLSFCGAAAQKRYKSFTWVQEDDKHDIDKILKKLKEELMPTENRCIERFVFNTRQQQPGEPVAEFVAELRRLASTCQFEKLTPENFNEELILGKLVCGLPDSAVRPCLLEEGNNLTLDKAITIVQCAEQVAQHSRVLESENTESCTAASSVSAVKHVPTPLHESSVSSSGAQCPNCGGDRHTFRDCPARGRQCFKCGKMNHFSSVCRGRWSREYTSTRPSKRINAINNIGCMDAATCEYRLDKKSVQFLVDCGATHHIKLKPEVHPVVHAQRRVQEPIREKVRAHLDELVEQEVIAPVNEATDWVGSPVIVLKKNGSVRLCLDVKELNSAICREHYTIPTEQEVSARLAGARIFSLFDTRQGFHHIRLDYESSLLCTFNTPFGRYRWLRLPFGLRSSPEVIQKHLMHALEGLEGVFICADDVLVVGYGDNPEEISHSHDRNCRALLERCRIKNIRLNHTKVRFKMSDVIYMGHRLTPQGMSPDLSKVTAITHMPPPQNVTQLRGFLSTVAYLARYLPRLSAVAEPLRAL